MIFLVSESSEYTKLEKDKLYDLSKLFEELSINHTLVFSKAIPFLRYKLSNININNYNIIRVYDRLIGINLDKGHPLSLDDIPLPSDISFLYSPNRTYLMKQDYNFGEVFYNEFGFVSKIRFHYSDTYYIDHIYDDRGFLSSKSFVNNSEVDKMEYFNEFGTHILTIKNDNIYWTKNARNNLYIQEKSLKKTINLIIDYISTVGRYENNVLITTSSNDIVDVTKKFTGKIVRLLTEDNNKINNKQEITVIYSKYHTYNNEDTNVKYLPLFVPKLNLFHNTEDESVKIYTILGNIFSNNLLNILIEYVIMDKYKSITFETETISDGQAVASSLKNLISTIFDVDMESIEYKKVKKYITAKEKNKLFTTDSDAVKDLKQTEKWESYVKAVKSENRVSINVSPTIDTVKEELSSSRLLLDLSNTCTLNYHAIAVGCGIPIVAIEKSDYIIENSNGYYLNDMEHDVIKALNYFIDDISNWNISQVTNIDIIKKYNLNTIKKRWEEFLFD